jgi:hypothetical protein
MSIRVDDNPDNYLGAEGNASASGIGLHWLKEDRLALLHDRLLEINATSALTWLRVLDHLATWLTAEHAEMAHQIDCTPEQLRAQNGKMSQLLRSEFTGYGWPFGWRYGRADAGEMHGATIYEMHPQVADRWKSAHVPHNRVHSETLRLR